MYVVKHFFNCNLDAYFSPHSSLGQHLKCDQIMTFDWSSFSEFSLVTFHVPLVPLDRRVFQGLFRSVQICSDLFRSVVDHCRWPRLSSLVTRNLADVVFRFMYNIKS